MAVHRVEYIREHGDIYMQQEREKRIQFKAEMLHIVGVAQEM
jgi:hypothetical protein